MTTPQLRKITALKEDGVAVFETDDEYDARLIQEAAKDLAEAQKVYDGLVARRADRLSHEAALDRARVMLEELTRAVMTYRTFHDLHGDGSMTAGRAWDLLKRAQEKAECLLLEMEKANG